MAFVDKKPLLLSTHPHTPPRSLKDSTASSKMKITKEKGVGICSLSCNTLGVEVHARTSKWGLGRVISESIIHTNLHKLNKLVNV
jgi:hypothetical protein